MVYGYSVWLKRSSYDVSGSQISSHRGNDRLFFQPPGNSRSSYLGRRGGDIRPLSLSLGRSVLNRGEPGAAFRSHPTTRGTSPPLPEWSGGGGTATRRFCRFPMSAGGPSHGGGGGGGGGGSGDGCRYGLDGLRRVTRRSERG